MAVESATLEAPTTQAQTAPSSSPSSATPSGPPNATTPTPAPATKGSLSSHEKQIDADRNRAKEIEKEMRAGTYDPSKAKAKPAAAPAEKPAEKPEAAAPATPPAEKPTETTDDAKDVYTVTRREKDDKGNPVEVKVTREQARQALLRDQWSAEDIGSLSKSRMLEMGAKRFVAQQDQDRFGTQAAQWRKAAEERQAANPAAPTPAPAAAPTATQTQPTTPPATPPVVTATPATQAAWKASLQQVREFGGDELGNALESTFSEIQQQFGQELAKVNERHDQQLQARDNLITEILFDHAFRERREQYPQLKDAKAQAEVRKAADAIAGSGRYANPYADRDTIVDEACLVVFGKQMAETHALQLVESQRRQRDGQPRGTQERQAQAVPQALSDRERFNRVAQEFANTGDVSKAHALSRELASQRG